MRKPVGAVAVAAVLVGTLVYVPAAALPERTPHENPTAARSSPDAASLLLFHADVFDLALRGEYGSAAALLDELCHAAMSDRLRYVIEQYGSLSRDLLEMVRFLEESLGEATGLLDGFRLSEAETLLAEAGDVLRSAALRVKDLLMTQDLLSRQLGLDALPADSRIQQAYGRLQSVLDRINELVSRLHGLWDSIATDHERMAETRLLPTGLTLAVSPDAAFVGEDVVASGQLTGASEALPGRTVTVLVAGVPVTEETDAEGRFQARLAIPERYVPTVVLVTEYAPSGDDLGVYAPTASAPVTLGVGFYRTSLELSPLEVAYAGKAFIVRGRVGSDGPAAERRVSLLLEGRLIAAAQVQDRFSLEPALPGTTPEGEYALTVAVASAGRYAGTSTILELTVAAVEIWADVRTPAVAILPGTIRVSGSVHDASGAVAGAHVRASLGESASAVKSAPDGTFAVELHAPMELSLAAPRELVVRIVPVEPYRTPLTVRRQVLAVNPAAVGMTLIALASVGVLVRRRVASRLSVPSDGTRVPAEGPRLLEPGRARPRKSAGAAGKVMDAYLAALAAVETRTGLRPSPSTTLRGFLRDASEAGGAAAGSFAVLTALAEAALYSAQETDEHTAQEAARLAAAVVMELAGETA